MRILITLIFLLACVSLQGQNIATDNIVWRVDNLKDSVSSESMPFVCEFKVYPGQQKIDWIQSNGEHVSTFQINATSIDWADINQEGNVHYDVTYQGKSGSFHIERSSTHFHIKLFILEGSKNLLPFTFNIANFSAL